MEKTVAILINPRISNASLEVSGSPISITKAGTCEKWDHMIKKGLKSKASLPKNFPNEVVHHPFLYNLKPFKQVQAEAKVSSVLQFTNDNKLMD
ncbi:hypothetical protein G9A89_022452 [Geosiphon pyriformis]|nr:hypothetical protein G9A89_022452 [Geosiphon pyriformis]